MADETKTILHTSITQTSMPEQKPTIELPAMTDRALLIDLTKVVKTGFADVRIMRGDLDLLVGDVASLKVDVRDLQRWKLDSDERTTRHSGGITRVSTNDATQDAAIASIKATVDKLEASDVQQAAKLDALTTSQAKQSEWMKTLYDRGATLWSDPKFVVLRNIAYLAIVGWAASRGLVAK